MKNLFTIILAVFLVNTISKAQDTLYIFQTGINVGKKSISDIDSLNFNNLADTLNIHSIGSKLNKKAISEIDSIIFYKPTVNVETSGIIFNPDLIYGTVTDCEGNTYRTITIGEQTWMAENLKTTKYCNGELIETTTSSNILNDTTSKYQWAYIDDENNVATYGRLYTWYAATDARGICPVGWHLPSDAEWTTLTDYLGGEAIAGGKLKEAGTTHWTSPNEVATNETGFTAIPSGFRYNGGTFDLVGSDGIWWSSIDGSTANTWSRNMCYTNSNVVISIGSKSFGFSVRCLRD